MAIFSCKPVRESRSIFPPLQVRNKTDVKFLRGFVCFLLLWLSAIITGMIVDHFFNGEQSAYVTAPLEYFNHLLYLVLIASLVACGFVFSMRKFAKSIVFLTLGLLVGLLILGAVFLIFFKASLLAYMVGLVLLLVEAITITMSYYLRDHIILGIEIMRQAARAYGNLWVPLVLFLLSIGVLIVGVYSFLCFSSLPSLLPTSLWFLAALGMYVNHLGIVWLSTFVDALICGIVAQSIGDYYQRRSQTSIQSQCCNFSNIRPIFANHLGTFAMGSLIFAVLIIVNQFAYWSPEYQTSSSLLMPLIVYSFLKFAFVECSLRGTNFADSARNAYNLIAKKFWLTFVLHTLFYLLLVVMIVLLILPMTLIGQMYATFLTQSPIFLLGAMLPVTFFMNIFLVAIDTVFISCLEDLAAYSRKSHHQLSMDPVLVNLFQGIRQEGVELI